MSITDRESEFENAVQQRFGPSAHLSPCYGTSNIARMVPGGIVLGISNLDNFGADPTAFVAVSRVCPVPNVELYIAANIQTNVTSLRARLQRMIELSRTGDDRFGSRNNNTSICLGPFGNIFAYNKKISELEHPPQEFLGNPIQMDAMCYAVYCPDPTPDEQRALRSLLRAIEGIVGFRRMTEIPLWGSAGNWSRSSTSAVADLHEMVERLFGDLESSHLQVEKALVRRLVASLMAKPFVILTGLSGSGKSKLAQACASWFAASDQQFAIVPVGSDWTSRDYVLGYADALSPGDYRLPSSGILQLILRASVSWAANEKKPFFLVLDEMNLSHVERYFADILSALESGEPILLHEDKPFEQKDWANVPPTVRLPPNLFIIGTVNIDETTYMFSPKVLDRTNVIEFLASRTQMEAFLSSPDSVALDDILGNGAGFSQNFVDEAVRRDVSLGSLDTLPGGGTVNESFRTVLLSLFDKLGKVGAEFGFRPAYEMSRFVYFHNKVTGNPWDLVEALDASILQKLLPKLHGSARKLGPILNELEQTCRDFPRTVEKIGRMRRRLQDNGFTSFAEA